MSTYRHDLTQIMPVKAGRPHRHKVRHAETVRVVSETTSGAKVGDAVPIMQKRVARQTPKPNAYTRTYLKTDWWEN